MCQIANYLKECGVKKGDTVTIYMPMLMELPAAMLACARIGELEREHASSDSVYVLLFSLSLSLFLSFFLSVCLKLPSVGPQARSTLWFSEDFRPTLWQVGSSTRLPR